MPIEESPLNDYILSYNELLYYLFCYTAIAVTVLYTVAGLLMFIFNKKLKFFFLPLIYAVLGAIDGAVYGCVLSATLAAVYISVPYSLTKIRTFYLACSQALVICYCKMSRNNRLSSIFVV